MKQNLLLNIFREISDAFALFMVTGKKEKKMEAHDQD